MNKVLAMGMAAALVGGCTMAPKYTRPDAPVPATLPTGGAYGTDASATTAPTALASDLLWQEFIQDERLEKIIATALQNNRDFRIAALNVERARALYGIARSELLPTVDANGSMARRHTPADLTNGGGGSGTTSKRYDVNMGVAAWEIDFFGRIRSLKDAALQEFFATEQGRRSAQILLISSVANAYLTLATDREYLKLAQTTLEAQQGAYDLVQRRFARGIAGELDVYRAQTQVDSARGDVARFTQRVARDENALTLLAGGPVAAELLPADLTAVLPPTDVAAGVSSDVLLRRPDILEAEHRLRAANANIGAARAAFFPRVSLTAAYGTASADLAGLFKSGSEAWAFAPQVTMPLFDARTWSAKKLTEEDKRIAIARYEGAIQSAFREVADALAIRGTVDQQLAAQESLLKAVESTYRISTVRYEKGLDSYLGVLDAQRELYSAQQVLVLLRLEKLVNQVRLYSALGGGWHPAEPLTAEKRVPQTQPAMERKES